MDLIYTGLAGKYEGLQMMTKVETGSHMGMSLVHCKKVSALVLEPISTGLHSFSQGHAVKVLLVQDKHPALLAASSLHLPCMPAVCMVKASLAWSVKSQAILHAAQHFACDAVTSSVRRSR